MTEMEAPNPWGAVNGIRPVKYIRILNEIEGLSLEEIYDRFLNEFHASREKVDLAFDIFRNEQALMAKYPPDGISLYVGIPFCPTRCLYCSFISAPYKKMSTYVDPFVDALLKEIEACGKLVSDLGLPIKSVYFGGGTPTALGPHRLEKIIRALDTHFDLSGIYEYTVEAGRPETVTDEMLEMLKRNRVGRISINPQSMHQKTLNAIGRSHTPQDIRTAFQRARAHGFDNINMDLIAALPNETLEDFSQTLDEVLALDPENITVHTMYIKRASFLNQNLGAYDFSQAADEMLRLAATRLRAHGHRPYYLYKQKNTVGNLENVGYAKPGTEGIYNVYSMAELQTILAMGGGGATKLVDRENDFIDRVFNVKDVITYIGKIDEMIERKERLREFYKKQ